MNAFAHAPIACLKGASVSLADLIGLRGVAQSWHAAAQAPTVLGGARRSRLRGRGVDFDEVRAYQAGDDVRSIDWRVTARTGSAHTKVFHEERERPVVSVIDARHNMAFGTRLRFKSVAAIELAALVAWRALAAGDRSGGLIAASDGVHLHRPRRNRHAVLAWLNDLATCSAALLGSPAAAAAPTILSRRTWPALTLRSPSPGSSLPSSPSPPVPSPPPPTLAHVLQAATRIARPGTLCVIASDFHDLDTACAAPLRSLARHCDVVCVLVFDAIEAQLPRPGRYPLTDGHTRRLLDAGDTRTRSEHRARFDAQRTALTDLCRGLRIGFGALPAHESALTVLQRQGPWPRHR